jgi:hypothetical protein
VPWLPRGGCRSFRCLSRNLGRSSLGKIKEKEIRKEKHLISCWGLVTGPFKKEHLFFFSFFIFIFWWEGSVVYIWSSFFPSSAIEESDLSDTLLHQNGSA